MPAFKTVARRAGRNFYTLMTIAEAVVVFLGFIRTYYLAAWYPDVASEAALETLFKVHGEVFTLQFLLAIAQARLIRRGNYALHRKAGHVGAGLAALMVVSGI